MMPLSDLKSKPTIREALRDIVPYIGNEKNNMRSVFIEEKQRIRIEAVHDFIKEKKYEHRPAIMAICFPIEFAEKMMECYEVLYKLFKGNEQE